MLSDTSMKKGILFNTVTVTFLDADAYVDVPSYLMVALYILGQRLIFKRAIPSELIVLLYVFPQMVMLIL